MEAAPDRLTGSGPLDATTQLPRSALAAGELLPQRGERLVGGEGATGLLGRPGGSRGRRGGRTRGCRLGTGVRRPRRLHLLGVGLPALAGLGVLPLPFLTLLVEAVEPLARLRVEALRVDVVALLVVGGRHAVEGRVEVLLALDEALVGLLE